MIGTFGWGGRLQDRTKLLRDSLVRSAETRFIWKRDHIPFSQAHNGASFFSSSPTISVIVPFNTVMHQPKRASLLSFPPELRLPIYAYVLRCPSEQQTALLIRSNMDIECWFSDPHYPTRCPPPSHSMARPSSYMLYDPGRNAITHAYPGPYGVSQR